MTLDRSKKYAGLGLAWRSNDPAPGWWLGFDGEGPHQASASDDHMQLWLEAGHIKPVKTTKIVRVEGVRFIKPPSGNLYSEFSPDYGIPDNAVSKPVTLEFEVEE